MKRNRLSLLGALALVAIGSVALAQRPQPTLDTTASALYLEEHPKADLTAPETANAVALIKKELEALLGNHVDASKHVVFYRFEPFIRGQVIIKFNPGVQEKVEALLDANGSFDATQPTGIAELDTLNAQQGIRQYTRRYKFSTTFTLVFDESKNPHIVADAFKSYGGTKFAEPNGVGMIGGGPGLSRIQAKHRGRNYLPTVYVLNLGWGDCPAGCIFNNRRYFEVRPSHDGTVKTAYVGEAGAALTPELQGIYK